MHEVLVNRLGGLSLPRKSVVRLTDRPDMTLDVYRGRKTTIQQHYQCDQQYILKCLMDVFPSQSCTARQSWEIVQFWLVLFYQFRGNRVVICQFPEGFIFLCFSLVPVNRQTSYDSCILCEYLGCVTVSWLINPICQDRKWTVQAVHSCNSQFLCYLGMYYLRPTSLFELILIVYCLYS